METFKQFNATQLYCAKCKTAVPVRERLLLVLPSGDLIEYLCVYCGSTVGKKTETQPQVRVLMK